MRDLSVTRLHEIVGGRLRLATLPPPGGEASSIARIVTDSRHVQAGDVFWALAGTRFDGACFAEEAYRRGAAGVVVGRRYVQPWPKRWSLQVDEGLGALDRLAGWNRDRFRGSVVAVTGSVGKTSTRQMIHAVLGAEMTGTASPKNYNNHVGLPLSMLEMNERDDYAVLELAASAPGEIACLARQCRPQIGVITRIGEAHLAGFGSPAAIAEAKAELLAELSDDGCAVLCGDDVKLRRIAQGYSGRVLRVGRSADCDVVATDVRHEDGRLEFRVDGARMSMTVWGRHYLENALAAVAVGREFGLSLERISAALAEFRCPPMRCEMNYLAGAKLIDDTYNASPTSMRAALELLREVDVAGRRIVVCGDMLELGEAAAEYHRQLGEEVVTVCGADMLLAVGTHSREIVAGARKAGMPQAQMLACQQPEEMHSYLESSVRAGDVVLVKGSRALAMERLVTSLRSTCELQAAA